MELLKETSLTDRQLDLVDTIISSNSVLLLLIEDILQLVKVEFENKQDSVQDILHSQTFGMGECLKSLKSIIIGYANQFSVELSFLWDDAVSDMYVHSNRSRLHQVLSNLLTNAVKASKKDSKVELTCKVLDTIEPASTTSRLVRFIVQDNGCGIPKSKIESIFEPFVQLNTNESKVPR